VDNSEEIHKQEKSKKNLILLGFLGRKNKITGKKYPKNTQKLKKKPILCIVILCEKQNSGKINKKLLKKPQIL
jgi:hypothetical protein